jgi:hydroxymethylglutaryl-CoA reductase
MARRATRVQQPFEPENATLFVERRSERSFPDTEAAREATIQLMDAHTSRFTSSGTAAWPRPVGAIGRLTGWLTSYWRALWANPFSRLEAAPTRYLEPCVNGQRCTVPLLRDSVGRCDEIAAVCELANGGGGLEAVLLATQMSAARVWLSGCEDGAQAPARIAAVAGQLLQIGMEGSPQRWMPLGCIPALEVHAHGADGLGVTLYTECNDAMGRSAIESAARAMAAPLAGLAGCTREPEIELGHVQAMRAKLRCRLSVEQLIAAAAPGRAFTAPQRARCDEALSWFGVDRHQPELAAAHNAFVIEGVSAAATALGLEAWRFIAAAQCHAARWGSCEPLARWRRQGHEVCGQLELPIDLDSACMALPFVGNEDARREAARRRVQLVAGVGLLASLAYVRAVLAANVRQGALAAEGPPAESASSGRMPRDSALAESGVRLIASEPDATRVKAG